MTQETHGFAWIEHARARLARWLQRGGLAVFLAPFLGALLARSLGALELLPLVRAALPFALLGGPALAGLGAALARVRLATGGALRVDEAHLHVEGGGFPARFARADVTGGVVSPTGRGATVELGLAGGDALRVGVASVEDGEAILAAAGVAERRVELSLADPRAAAVRAFARVAGLVVLWLGGLGMVADALKSVGGRLPPWVGLVWLASFVVTLLALRRRARPAVLTLGSDGLRVDDRRGLRALPLAEIASCRAEGRALVVELESGEVERIEAGPAADEAALAGLARSVRERLARAEGRPEARAERFTRGGRSVGAWREALAALGQGGAYRSGDERAAAERVLDDPAASPEARVGAAVALARADDAGARRVRVAAEGVASPALRVALARAAEGEIEEAALEEAEREAGTATAPRPGGP